LPPNRNRFASLRSLATQERDMDDDKQARDGDSADLRDGGASGGGGQGLGGVDAGSPGGMGGVRVAGATGTERAPGGVTRFRVETAARVNAGSTRKPKAW
jgi:hypothetical protein